MSSGAREITSWKEIAHHLGVNVRTAQKWERRGLPVRHAPGARGRVSADIESLDRWKHQLTRGLPVEERCYIWPLGQGVSVEIRFLGADLHPAHIDLLREYLNLVKTALCSSADP